MFPIVIIGMGPGNPELLTLAAKNALEEADVILFDCMPDDTLLKTFQFKGEIIAIDKKPDPTAMLAAMEAHYRAGKKVCRLKPGDALIFNGTGKEIRALKAKGIDFHLIPGITASCAAANIFAVPITEMDESDVSVNFVYHNNKTNHQQLKDLAGILKYGSTIHIYFADTDCIGQIVEIITSAGVALDMPVVVASRISAKDETSVKTTLGKVEATLRSLDMKRPMLFIIGKYVEILSKKQVIPLDNLLINKLSN